MDFISNVIEMEIKKNLLFNVFLYKNKIIEM